MTEGFVVKVPLPLLLALVLLALLARCPALAGPPEGASGRMAFDEVSAGLLRYRLGPDPLRRAKWLKELASTFDPRVAVVLGEALTDPALAARVTATNAILEHYSPYQVKGGTEQQMEAAAKWWKTNEGDLRRRAKELPR